MEISPSPTSSQLRAADSGSGIGPHPRHDLSLVHQRPAPGLLKISPVGLYILS